jgi:branched-chain amino acid transport system substrate-binding protein
VTHRRNPRIVQCLVGLLLALSALQGCGAQQEEEVAGLKIAVIAPFSGDYALLGEGVRNGVLLAAEAWNGQGGVLGEQIQLVLKDSQCTFTGGRDAAQAAIEENVLFIIGAVCASASEGVAQVASRSGVLQISPASVNLSLTLDGQGKPRPLVFRVPVIDPDQGTVAARYALEQMGARKAGMLYSEQGSYGLTLAGAFRTAFVEGGGEIVASKAYDQNAETFFDSLDIVRSAQPDVLYLPGYHTVMNRLVPQARQFGLLLPIIGSDGWDSPELDLSVVEGCTYTSHFYPQEDDPLVQGWNETYLTRFLTEPDALATLSYDAANLLFTAITEAGIKEPLIVAEVLERISFTGVSGSWTYSAAHNPLKPLIMLRVENGRVVSKGRYAAPPPPAPVEGENSD